MLYLIAARVECFNEGLHSACCLWSTWNSSSESWIPCWCVHSLPHDTNQDGITLVWIFTFLVSDSVYVHNSHWPLATVFCVMCFLLVPCGPWFMVFYFRFCSRSLLSDSLDPKDIDRIPGRQNDRKTLLGEMNWIFTAVTDTSAWNVSPHGIEPL